MTAYTGEAAHIKGEKPGAARFDAAMSDDERNDFANLIYLCGDCHTKIDKMDADWPDDRLFALKAEHEAKVSRAVEETFVEVNFPELEKVTAWVSTIAPVTEVVDFTLITPGSKINKNKLTNGSRYIIAAGLSSRKVVADFVEKESQLDSDFPERLRSGFLSEYHALMSKGHRHNELFELMCIFAQRGAKTQAERTAGLAVLVYLFEICDVFEK